MMSMTPEAKALLEAAIKDVVKDLAPVLAGQSSAPALLALLYLTERLTILTADTMPPVSWQFLQPLLKLYVTRLYQIVHSANPAVTAAALYPAQTGAPDVE